MIPKPNEMFCSNNWKKSVKKGSINIRALLGTGQCIIKENEEHSEIQEKRDF